MSLINLLIFRNNILQKYKNINAVVHVFSAVLYVNSPKRNMQETTIKSS